jgi:hypothetical protein
MDRHRRRRDDDREVAFGECRDRGIAGVEHCLLVAAVMQHAAGPDRQAVDDDDGCTDLRDRGGKVELLFDRHPRRRPLGAMAGDALLQIVVACDHRTGRDVRDRSRGAAGHLHRQRALARARPAQQHGQHRRQ